MQARHGGYIVPEIKVLKTYIEKEMETVIISRDIVEDKIFQDAFSYPHWDKEKENRVKFEDEPMENAFNQLKELNRRIKKQQRPKIQDQEENKELKDFIQEIKKKTEAVLPHSKTGHVFKQENQARYPRDNLPPFPQRHVPYLPDQNAPEPYLKFYYSFGRRTLIE
ncbi:hypothetical protein O181_028237 [Austropuccinia psidii MF-1]|uniref:Uncharacterized protein n=1 Tax=Austropuccinia psidii MF-1 TaxID=1389203 RepID=A0A9Q3CU66_9BASI|nr:hypothetical protein [Austropuccinia psidii MF-1]